jgi:hypothetical protein
MEVPSCVILVTLLTGCFSGPGEISNMRVSYRFDNVRSGADRDEWLYIRDILQQYAVNNEVKDRPVVGSEREVGDTTVSQFLADLKVATLSDLNAIHADLDRLSRRKFADHERIEFKYLRASADLAYASNYVMAGLEIVLRGITDPHALVSVYLHNGKTAQPEVDPAGRWAVTLKVAPDRRFIYGYTVEKNTDVKKYFRIDIFSQVQQDVGSDEFESLRKREP